MTTTSYKYDAMNINKDSYCNNDNWGMPLQDNKPKAKRGYYEYTLQPLCEKQFQYNEYIMSEKLSMATAIYSKNTDYYDNYQSIDLIPENKDKYFLYSPWGKSFDFTAIKQKTMLTSMCTLKSTDIEQNIKYMNNKHINKIKKKTLKSDKPNNVNDNNNNDNIKGTWEITKIGPFHTTGGYDWIQVGWDDIFGFSSILKQYKDGIYVIEQFMSPVFKNGTRISHPPIHIHHMHIGVAPYVRQRSDPYSCLVLHKGCFNPYRTMETHGDYVCSEEDGGLDCRIESYANGYGMLVTHPLGLEGELNDVRASNSEELVWYWEIGAKWVPRIVSFDKDMSNNINSIKPLSMHNFAGPGTYNIAIQKSLLLTFPVSTHSETFFWYTGRMQFGGELKRMKIHAHNNLFQEAIFFAASPKDLGIIEENGFSMNIPPYIAIKPLDIGFQTNHELKEFLLNNLLKSQSLYNENHQNQHNNNHNILQINMNCGYPNPACHINKPTTICQSYGSLEVIDDIAYDRKEPTCCIPWKWESGQVFTVVGFNKHQGYPLGLHSPNVNNLPDSLPGHIGWWLYYNSIDDLNNNNLSSSSSSISHYSYSLYNHLENGGMSNISSIAGYQKIAMLINGYTSPNFNSWLYTPNSFIALIIYGIVMNLTSSIIILINIIIIIMILTYRKKITMLRSIVRYCKDRLIYYFKYSNEIDKFHLIDKHNINIMELNELEENKTLLNHK